MALAGVAIAALGTHVVCFDLDVGGIPWQTCRSGRTARYILGRSQLLCLFCDNALSQYYGVCLVVGIPNAKVCPCDSIFSLLYAPSPRMWIFTYMWSRVLEPCMRAKRGKGRIYYFFESFRQRDLQSSGCFQLHTSPVGLRCRGIMCCGWIKLNSSFKTAMRWGAVYETGGLSDRRSKS